MAEYLVLIYQDESAYASASADELQALYEAHGEFADKHGPVLRGGQALESTHSATSIRRSDPGEELVITDGPFAETKEALGGFYVIDAPDLDAAIAVAKDVPAPHGGVEVRPIRVFD